jgi:hypothetical protein
MKKQQTPKDVKVVTLRLPADLYEQVAARAKQEERSLNAQIVWELRQAAAR